MARALDRIDFEILRALQNDGRASNKSLAAEVGLAPSSCLARMRRLRTDGVLRGIHADIAPDALGVGLEAILAVSLSAHDSGAFLAFGERAVELDEVVAVYHVAGRHDFLVHVAVRDAEHLRTLVLDKVTGGQDVARLETFLVFGATRKPGPPIPTESLG